MAVSLQVLGLTLDGRSVRVFEDVPVAGPTTVAALIAGAPEASALVAQGATILVNGERAALDTAVGDGDEVSVVQTIAGG